MMVSAIQNHKRWKRPWHIKHRQKQILATANEIADDLRLLFALESLATLYSRRFQSPLHIVQLGVYCMTHFRIWFDSKHPCAR